MHLGCQGLRSACPGDLTAGRRIELIEDEGLLEEVSGLVEWPVVLMGAFEEEYLSIPGEVIRLTIRANQKCFVTRRNDGSLSNKFILIAKHFNSNNTIVRLGYFSTKPLINEMYGSSPMPKP